MTHTLPMPTRQALRAHFRLVYRIVKRCGMFRDMPGDAEASSLNGVHLLQAYRGNAAVAEIVQHVAADVRTGDAQPLLQAPYFALTSDSCTDRSAKKEELLYVRFPEANQILTRFFSLQALGGGGCKVHCACLQGCI